MENEGKKSSYFKGTTHAHLHNKNCITVEHHQEKHYELSFAVEIATARVIFSDSWDKCDPVRRSHGQVSSPATDQRDLILLAFYIREIRDKTSANEH